MIEILLIINNLGNLIFCKQLGFIYFVERDSDHINIMVNNKIESYKILKIKEFTNDRKRMSVVV